MKKTHIYFLLTTFIYAQIIHANINSSIKGRVIDKSTNQPLVGVNVHIIGTVRGAGTDNDGYFIIDNMPPGKYEIHASMLSYKKETKPIELKSNENIHVDFLLKEKPIELNPVVVLGGKIEQRQDEAAVSLSVINRKELEQRNPVNLIEALESAAGVHFVGEQINIRGSTGYTFGAGNKVLLLLDGVPVYQSDTGQFNWDMLPPLDIEQIEILKGAGSTLWGASALGGVVNVITKKPSPEGRLMFSTTYGRYDRPYYNIWEWTNHNRLHYTRTDVSLSRQFGKLGVRSSLGQFNSTGYQQLGDFNKTNATLRLDYHFPRSITWTTYIGYSYIRKGFFLQWKGPNEPYEVDESNLDNYAATNQLNVYSKVAWPVSPHFGVNIRASFVRSLMGNQFGEGSDFNPALGQGVEIQTHWLPHEDHTITTGIQYQMDTGNTELTGDHAGYFIGPYLQDEWRIRQNLRVTGGLRYDRYKLVDGLKEELFSPRFGFNWQPWSGTAIRGSVGSGFRAATIVERFLELSIMNFNILPNPGIKAESSWAYDLGFRQQLTENWNIDISLFDNEYSNLIEAHLDLIRGQIQFRNIDRARIQGIEATTKMSFPFYLFNQEWIPGLYISWTGMNHKELKWNEPLPYRPDVIYTIRTFLKLKNFEFQADYRYASRIESVKVYPINDRVPMKFVDMRLSYEVWYFKAILGVQNLLNYNYSPMESNLMPMRTFTVGLQGEF